MATVTRNLDKHPALERCAICSAQLCYRGRQVECSACGTPVAPDHPLQAELTQQWQERDARDQAERERVAKSPAPVNPVVYDEAPLFRTLAIVEAQGKRIDALERELKALKDERRKK